MSRLPDPGSRLRHDRLNHDSQRRQAGSTLKLSPEGRGIAGSADSRRAAPPDERLERIERTVARLTQEVVALTLEVRREARSGRRGEGRVAALATLVLAVFGLAALFAAPLALLRVWAPPADPPSHRPASAWEAPAEGEWPAPPRDWRDR